MHVELTVGTKSIVTYS